jgi:hypothetical protein
MRFFFLIDNLVYWGLKMKGEVSVRKLLRKEATDHLFNYYKIS